MRIGEVESVEVSNFIGYTKAPVEVFKVGTAAQRDVLAVIDDFVSRERVGCGTAAEPRTSFEKLDLKAGVGERNRRSETGESTADDSYGWRGHSPGFHNPTPARSIIHAFSRRDKLARGCLSTS